MNPRPAVIHSGAYACDIGPHVFPMEKFGLVREQLLADGDIDERDIVDPDDATRAELELVHTAEYLDDLEQLRWTPRTMWSELPLAADIVRAYVRCAGGTIRAAREALARRAAINIGGGFHHALADKAEGFCYINDLAVAARVLRHDGAVERVAVVDVDVHQGNGTAAIFRDEPEVFTFSIHQEANYPMPKPPSDLDIGLANETGDEAYLRELDRGLERVWAFRPEIVLYQAGADPFTDDLLGGLAMSLDGLEARDRHVLGGCAERGIPFVITLGGGYARRREDTVHIHVQTCRVGLEAVRHAGASS